MINIVKGKPPKELLEYKTRPDAKFDGPGFSLIKQAIRSSLLKEQGYLCAYCMVGLADNPLKVKIEHWHSQSKYPEKSLDYKNLLAVCKGNSIEQIHCDSAKSKFDKLGPIQKDLHFNPSNPDHNMDRLVRYLADGQILGVSLFDEDIRVLNLNAKRLVNDRRAVWDSVSKVLNHKSGSRTKIFIKNLIKYWTEKEDGRYKPYCGIVIYLLNKSL